VPEQVQAAPVGQINGLLESLARSELLVNRAVAEGIEIPSSRQDSIAEGILAGVKGIAQELGFLQLTPQEGEGLDAAADRVVRDILVQVVQQNREVYPLQTVAFALKEQHRARIFQAGLARTVELVDELRAQPIAAPGPVPDPVPADTTTPDPVPADTTTPDTVGGQG
jgi:hypothetical protein